MQDRSSGYIKVFMTTSAHPFTASGKRQEKTEQRRSLKSQEKKMARYPSIRRCCNRIFCRCWKSALGTRYDALSIFVACDSSHTHTSLLTIGLADPCVLKDLRDRALARCCFSNAACLSSCRRARLHHPQAGDMYFVWFSVRR